MSSAQQQEKMSIVQHLIELRSTLLRSVIAIVIFFLVLFPFADDIYTFIAAPIVQAIPGSNLIAIGVISPFLTPLKMSLFLARDEKIDILQEEGEEEIRVTLIKQ